MVTVIVASDTEQEPIVVLSGIVEAIQVGQFRVAVESGEKAIGEKAAEGLFVRPA